MAVQRWKILTREEARRKDILGSSPIAQAIPSFPGPDGVDGVLVGVVLGGVVLVLVVVVIDEGGLDEGGCDQA